MSFAKSKRFVEPEAPRPTPIKALTTPTRRHCASPTESIESYKSSVKSVRSITSASCFRTPIPPVRRRLCTQSERKDKPDLKSQKVDEELQEKIVECMNKTQSIKELESQIEEYKTQISELKLLTQKNSNFELEEYETKLNELTETKQQQEVEIMQLKSEISALKDEKELLIFVYEEKRLNLDSLLLQSEEKLYDIQKEYEDVVAYNTELQEKVKSNQVLQSKVIVLRKRLMEGNKKLKDKQKVVTVLQKRVMQLRSKLQENTVEKQSEIHLLEKQLMEQELIKKNELAELETHLLELLGDLERQNESLVKQHKLELDEVKRSYQEQLQKVQEEKREQLGFLKKTLDENKHFSMKLSDTERDLRYILDSKNQLQADQNRQKLIINELQRTLSKTIVELNDTREHYASELKTTHTEKEQLKTQIRRFKINLDETLNTVQVLTKRVLESDQGFEQLKSELTTMETNYVQLESEKMNILQELEQVRQSHQQLTQSQNAERAKLKQEVAEKMNYFTEMVDLYKQQALSVMQQSEEQGAREQKAQEEIRQLELQNEALKEEKVQLCDELRVFDGKLTEAQNMITVAKNEIDRTETENTDLKFKISRLESQVQSLQLASEKGKMDKMAEEGRKLREQVKKLEMQLKDKQELETKVNIQNKLIEKLRSEISSPKANQQRTKKFENKENLPRSKNGTPVHEISNKVNTNRIESPNTTPLRERNIRQ